VLREIGDKDSKEDDTGSWIACQHLLFHSKEIRSGAYIEREKLRKPGDARALQWGVRESISVVLVGFTARVDMVVNLWLVVSERSLG
jgi:hypothetical protein